MATFVLVHGGGHGGWCYQRVSRLLRSAGHEVHVPTMTGLGERSHLVGPHVDLSLHVQDIAAVLHYEDLRDVILVGHSYGGMVITGVGGMAPDRISKLVYLDAANPKNGQSLVDVAGRHRDGAPGRPGSQRRRTRAAPLARRRDVLRRHRSRRSGLDGRPLTGHPWKCFGQKLDLRDEAGYAKIPQYHVVCTSTLATRDPVLMDEARAAGRLWDIDTGHDLMITEPQKVADALAAVAAAD